MPSRPPESAVLDLIRQVWTKGSERRDRTGVGTRALFGAMLRFDLSDGTVPLLTTKRVFWKSAVKELVWFLEGQTNIRPLVAQGVHIWTDWPMERHHKATGETLTRDEFEAVREMAIKARDENDALKARIEALEAQLAAKG